MAVVSDEIYSLLIPLVSERLVVPRSCVAEVVRYSEPVADQETASWFCGMIDWNEQRIPVVSFEALCDEEVPSTTGRTRIVVFNPLGGSSGCPPYGVLSEGFPQMVKVNREVISLDTGYSPAAAAPVFCQISMLKEHALIPDMETIEARVAAALDGAG